MGNQDTPNGATTVAGAATARLLMFFQHNPDVLYPMQELCKETGLTSAQVANAVSSLTRQGMTVERVGRGVYRWPSKPQPVPEKKPSMESGKAFVVEFLGDTTKGMLVRGEDNKLYVMSSVKL